MKNGQYITVNEMLRSQTAEKLNIKNVPNDPIVIENLEHTIEQLDAILKDLSSSDKYGYILRAKGILCTPDKKWLHFDLVPGEYEIREGAADYTGRICVIGKDLVEEDICQLFGVE